MSDLELKPDAARCEASVKPGPRAEFFPAREVPLAISQAFRDGRLGVMDYYNLRNLQSDTEMRNAIAHPGRNDHGDRPLS